MTGLTFIEAGWPGPKGVHAVTTTRAGGASDAPFDALNLGGRVGDRVEAVTENRQRLASALHLPEPPRWLRQVHGRRVVSAESVEGVVEADGVITGLAGIVCAVLTADCLPIFLCDRSGEKVGLLHAGWRGLAAGVIESGVAALEVNPASIMAWLGPAIGPRAFEVGEDVREAFAPVDGAQACFTPSGAPGKWLANLYALARSRLRGCGVDQVWADETMCTFTDADRFFSYRRSNRCGRMASLIWRVD